MDGVGMDSGTDGVGMDSGTDRAGTDGVGTDRAGPNGASMDEDSAIQLRRVIGHLARQLNASSTGAGLTPSQASVLGLIVARGPLSLVELGKLEGLNPTMLSRVISRLAAMGLINRIPDPEDLRSASVVSAAAGRRVDQQIKARRAAAVSQCMQLLPADDVAVVTAALPALERLADAMRHQAAAGAPS